MLNPVTATPNSTRCSGHHRERDADACNDGDHVVLRLRDERLDGAAPDGGNEVDRRIDEECAEQHGARAIAVGEQVNGGPDREPQQHRMPDDPPQMSPHVRCGEQDERNRHGVRRDRAGGGEGREDSRAIVGDGIADDDQHEPDRRDQREHIPCSAARRSDPPPRRAATAPRERDVCREKVQDRQAGVALKSEPRAATKPQYRSSRTWRETKIPFPRHGIRCGNTG